MQDFALLGYTYILEQAGIRFAGLGGTSFGALIAALIAAKRETPDQPCSLKVLEAVMTMPKELSKAIHQEAEGDRIFGGLKQSNYLQK